MTTIVQNPAPSDSGNGMGMVIGLLLVVLVAILFFVYGLPALRSSTTAVPEVKIPDTINVNVQPAK